MNHVVCIAYVPDTETKIKIGADAGEQRIDVFDQRRHHQLIAAPAKQVEQRAAHVFHAPGLRRQHVLDVFG